MGNETFYHALKINSEVCTGCTHCMNVCPTAAIRIKYGKATINEAACTDCGMCLKTCPRQAIYVEQDDFNQIFKLSCYLRSLSDNSRKISAKNRYFQSCTTWDSIMSWKWINRPVC